MSENAKPRESIDSNCVFVHENADAFALQALSTDESRRVVEHVATHPECWAIINEAIATTGLLALSMPLLAEPDLAVKLRLFDRIAAESVSVQPAPNRIQTGNDIVAAFSTSQPVTKPTTPNTPRRNWVQYVSAALVAPLAIALAVVSLLAFNMNDELDDMRNATATVDASSSSSIEMLTMESSDSDSSVGGFLGTMPDQQSAILMAWDLDPKQEHQVWCEESDGQKTMVSSLAVSDDGDAMQTIKFPGPINGYTRIFVAGSDSSDADAPELILTIPEKVGSDDDQD